MVRIKDGNYIAIFYDKMIEVKADSKRDAYNKAKRYFESREHRELFDYRPSQTPRLALSHRRVTAAG